MTAQTAGNGASGPLEGLNVLDFGTFVAGSYNAVLMGDLGAKVIKVEPLAGDPARQVGPFLKGESRIFIGWNRNKLGLAVDLRKEAGRQIVYDLTATTDIVTGNYRPGIAEKLKVDYETLSAINPRIIYLASSGYGQTGPLRDRPTYDAIFQTTGGIAYANQFTTGKVAITAAVFIDIHTAMLGLSAILAALYHRERCGVGQKVETSLLQGAMSVQPSAYVRAIDTEETPFVGGYPYALFEAKEGQIFVAAIQDKFWKAFCKAAGQPELGANSKYDTNPKRGQHREELDDIIRPFMLEKTALEWEEILVEAGVPCGIVHNHDEFLVHPQVEAVGMNPIVDHPTIGPLRMYGVPFNLEKTPGRIQRSAPRLGEHSESILAELDYDQNRIAKLKADGVIATPAD